MTGGLWRNHRNRGGDTQAGILLSMLRQARTTGVSLELPQIMAAGIAQHGARFNELRAHGFVIVNQTERRADGRVLSRYWLQHDPERDGKQ
jgi:hypothetical protein